MSTKSEQSENMNGLMPAHSHSPPTQIPSLDSMAKALEELEQTQNPPHPLKELYDLPYMKAFRMNRPPDAELTKAGEKALRELGIFNPSCPGMHLNPYRTPPGSKHTYGTREYYADAAATRRRRARIYANRAFERRQREVTLRRQISNALLSVDVYVRGAKLRRLERHLQDVTRQAEKWEKHSRIEMTKAYVRALEAIHSPTRDQVEASQKEEPDQV